MLPRISVQESSKDVTRVLPAAAVAAEGDTSYVGTHAAGVDDDIVVQRAACNAVDLCVGGMVVSDEMVGMSSLSGSFEDDS